MKNGNTLEWRINQLEQNYTSLNDKVDKIMENHLPHLKMDVQSLSTTVKVGVILNIGAVLLAAAILKLL